MTAVPPADWRSRLDRAADRLAALGAPRAFDPADRAPRSVPHAPTPDRTHPAPRLVSLEAALEACGLRDGATLSFHHHLRNGDGVLNAVLDIAAGRGLRGLRIAASSIFPVHAPLADHMRARVVAELWTDYVRGPVAEAIGDGALSGPLVLQSHGGRARAVAARELEVDAAFIAAPMADASGAATGARGRATCGPLGYPMVDAEHARQVVIVAEDLSETTLIAPEIPAARVDWLVQVPSIGDPGGVRSGTTLPAEDPVGRALAALAARTAAAAGLLTDGFSFQTGAGGAPLASAAAIGAAMGEAGVVGGFVSGGITAAHVALVEAGLFREIRDVQCFDLDAARSFARDPWHHGMSAAEYASPIHPDPVAHRLDLMVLGAAEIDRDFNVNVTLGGDGLLIGGPGGHPDTAAGARVTMALTRLTGGGHAKLVEAVRCRTTPGEDVDLVLTEMGVAVHPAREDLRDRLAAARIPLVEIDAMIARAAAEATRTPAQTSDHLLGYVESRDGAVMDALFAPATG